MICRGVAVVMIISKTKDLAGRSQARICKDVRCAAFWLHSVQTLRLSARRIGMLHLNMYSYVRRAIVLTLLTTLSSLVTVSSNGKRQTPAEPTGVTVIKSPNGAEIRYKEPGKEGVCETTPGINSYSGYVSLNATTNMFFWFFEARENAAQAPLTLWLNGRPGSDSLIGLFEELDPCYVSANLTTQINPYSWSNVSNMLFLSQPVGVGFSYATTKVGYEDYVSGDVTDTKIEGETSETKGRFSLVDPYR